MRQLETEDIVELADLARTKKPAALALAVLARAEANARPETLTLGHRDALLLGVRAQICGPTIELVSRCPHCEQMLQLAVTAGQLGLESVPDPAPRTIETAGRTITVRAVTAGDLAAAEEGADVQHARTLLLRAVAPGADDDSLEAIEDIVEKLDPAAETTIGWSCPNCGNEWTEVFDASVLLASDLGSRAQQVLAEVASLALTYHWSERDILAMPAHRRRFYLEAAG